MWQNSQFPADLVTTTEEVLNGNPHFLCSELCVMTLKADAKLKGKLTRGLKNDIRNLVNFYETSRKSGNLHFDGLLFSKAYKDLDENVQQSYVSWHWRVM